MRKHLLILGSFIAFLAILMPGTGHAEDCSDPKLLRDPRVLIDPCSKVISDPNSQIEQRVRAFEYRARAHRFAKEFDSALADVNVALSLKSNDPALYSARARIYENQRNLQDSWTDHLQAINLDPDNPVYYKHFISFCINAGISGCAQELLDYTDKSFPNNFSLKLMKAWYYRALNNHHRTVLVLTDAIKNSTVQERDDTLLTWRRREMWGDVPFQILLSEALLNDHQWDEALKAADAAVALRRDAATLTAHALVHFSWPVDGRSPSRLPAALAEIDEALKDDPAFAYAHAARGMILLYLNRPQDALASINEAIRLDPDDDMYVWRRFRVNRALDDVEAAERDLLKYISNRNNLPGVVSKLRARGYWLEAELPESLTPVFRAGLRACARDKGC